MDATDWMPTYRKILADFGWTETGDRASAQRLHALLSVRDPFLQLGTELKNRSTATVVGCGPALDSLTAADFPAGVVVACDGATARLRELGILPRIVVTDLDGESDALHWAAAQGSTLVVHAHGDNQDRIEAIVPDLGPILCGTYQSTPDPALHPLRNFGGFTDGDRAVVLCEAYRVATVNLLAFDFDAQPSRYSHYWDPGTKPRKLAWAKRIIEGVQARGTTRVQHWVPG